MQYSEHRSGSWAVSFVNRSNPFALLVAKRSSRPAKRPPLNRIFKGTTSAGKRRPRKTSMARYSLTLPMSDAAAGSTLKTIKQQEVRGPPIAGAEAVRAPLTRLIPPSQWMATKCACRSHATTTVFPNDVFTMGSAARFTPALLDDAGRAKPQSARSQLTEDICKGSF